VRDARRAQDRVAGPYAHPVGGGQHVRDPLPAHPAGQLVLLDVTAEPEVDDRVRGGLDDDPRLGLAVRRGQVRPREAPVRVDVERQPLPRVEELDEDRGIGAVPGDVRGAEPALRLGGDGVRERVSAGERRQAARRGTGARGDRPDPVFGMVRIGAAGRAAEPVDAARAPVERARHVGRQLQGLHVLHPAA